MAFPIFTEIFLIFKRSLSISLFFKFNLKLNFEKLKEVLYIRDCRHDNSNVITGVKFYGNSSFYGKIAAKTT